MYIISINFCSEAFKHLNNNFTLEYLCLYLFIYLGFYVTFNTVQVISRWVVGRAEETSTYSSLGFCTVNCRPTVSNYQLSHLRPWRGSNPSLRGGGESVTTLPLCPLNICVRQLSESVNIVHLNGETYTKKETKIPRNLFFNIINLIGCHRQ